MCPTVYVVSACRTPLGSLNGRFGKIPASDLAKPVLQEAIDRSRIPATDIDEIYIGNILTAGKGQNPARRAAIISELPIEVPATTINMQCASGIKSVIYGFNNIWAGSSSIVLCGGMENMSLADHTLYVRSSLTMGNAALHHSLYSDGLYDSTYQILRRDSAQVTAQMYNISREEQDIFAFRSHKLAGQAMDLGYFNAEIVGVRDPIDDRLILEDESPNQNITLEWLKSLPADTSVTAGNSAGPGDGAAAIILADSNKVNFLQLSPMARIINYTEIGIDPMILGTSPIRAIKSLMEKVHWTIEDVDLYEIHESHAVQVLAVIKELGIDETKVNVSGGAIAFGHPVGASATCMLVTLIYNLKRLNLRRGIAAITVGGGMELALAIELCPMSV